MSKIVGPRYADDPVKIVVGVGNARMTGEIYSTTMQDLCGDEITAAQRVDFARQHLPVLSRLVEARCSQSQIRTTQVTLEDLETHCGVGHRDQH